ncbi:MAG: MJ1255/VC2487 family glycosyltransferase [Nanoarchaeota archaeon]
MNILYGVSGVGFGHSSRALVVADYLEKKGHNVLILTYGQAYKVLKKRFKVFKVSGLTLIFSRGILKKQKTVEYNAKNFSKNLFRFRKFNKLMQEFQPDLCIADMEPIVPILSFWYKKPLVCFDNQHRLTNINLNIPKKYYPDYLMAKAVVHRFVSKADFFIITSFADEPVKNKNSFVVFPIIRDEVKKIKGCEKDKVLVYLSRPNNNLIKILRRIDEKFVVYGYNKNEKSKNLEFKTSQSFLQDLSECKAIIATSGFSLISEALYLRKPYLGIPLKGQFEQILNAIFLEQSGFGAFSEDLTEEDVRKFLSNLGKYKKNLKKYKPDFNRLYKVWDKVLNEIEKKIKH